MIYKRIPTAVLALLLFFIVQSSVLKGLSLSGAIPNLLLVLTVSYGYLRGETSAMTVGFFSGLLLDIFGMNIIGLYALIYLYLGYLAGLCHTWYEPAEYRIPLAMIIIAEIIVLGLEYLFFFVLNGDFGFVFYLKGKALPEFVSTMLSSLAIYPALLWTEERFVNIDPAEKKKKEDWNVSELVDNGGKKGTE